MFQKPISDLRISLFLRKNKLFLAVTFCCYSANSLQATQVNDLEPDLHPKKIELHEFNLKKIKNLSKLDDIVNSSLGISQLFQLVLRVPADILSHYQKQDR